MIARLVFFSREKMVKDSSLLRGRNWNLESRGSLIAINLLRFLTSLFYRSVLRRTEVFEITNLPRFHEHQERYRHIGEQTFRSSYCHTLIVWDRSFTSGPFNRLTSPETDRPELTASRKIARFFDATGRRASSCSSIDRCKLDCR